MKRLLLSLLLCLTASLKSQDKLFFLNGDIKSGKVKEIFENYITFESEESIRTYQKKELLLAEFKSGKIEIYNKVTTDVFLSAGPGTDKRLEMMRKKTDTTNLFSINSLGLCNADVSLFYEHLFYNNQIGIGAMGAYNFNKVCTFFNLFILPLSNSKKTYDLGCFLNLYNNSVIRRIRDTQLTYGVFLKYTEFTYTGVYEEKINSGGVIAVRTRYVPSKGSQFATIFTAGTYTRLTPKIFVKTIAGLGGFNLKGSYRQQYNYQNSAGGKPSDVGFLPKLYIAINAGFNF